jgi:hypothetical protein
LRENPDTSTQLARIQYRFASAGSPTADKERHVSIILPTYGSAFSTTPSGLYVPASSSLLTAPSALHTNLSSSAVGGWLAAQRSAYGAPIADAQFGSSWSLIDRIAADERHQQALALFRSRTSS